jgi:O-antigen ligase
MWGLTIGGTVIAVALPFTEKGIEKVVFDPLRGFKAANALSVELAVLIAFLGVAWVIGWGGRRWRRVAPFCVAGMTVGLAFSHGRGGWLAALVGLAWLMYRRVASRRAAVISVAICAAAIIAYNSVSAFRYEVNRTINPDLEYLSRYQIGSLAIDQGGRPKYWIKEGSKVIEAPILGRGFFNRNPGSGLDWVGSHNFWIQMFLESGLPGGAAVLGVLWLLWRESRSRGLLPVEVSLIVVFVGGMGGEYFYGGMPLLVALVAVGMVFSPIGGWVAIPPRPFVSIGPADVSSVQYDT